MVTDIHLHTRFSFDSSEEPENFINKARTLGVPAVGFTEHYDLDAVGDEGYTLSDVASYMDEYARLRKQFPETEILRGIELGYDGRFVGEYKKLVEKYPFDYVINSVHTLPGRGDSYYPRFFEGTTVRKAYLDYFNAVLASVRADYDFQIIGHIGYVSRYCKGENAKIKYCDYAEIFDEILNEIISRGKCLEINTSSGEAGCDFLPDKDVIERYLSLGGTRLSFASDAHSAGKYLNKADKVTAFLKSLGVKQMCYFKDRKCIFYDI